jgi:hypothetical protein
LESLVNSEDGTVSVRIVQSFGRQLLPAAVAKLVRGDLTVTNCETWSVAGDGRVHGQCSLTVPGLGSGEADAWVVREGSGSQVRHAVQVAVKIPVVGGKFEKAIGAGLANNINSAQRFTDAWIADHA